MPQAAATASALKVLVQGIGCSFLCSFPPPPFPPTFPLSVFSSERTATVLALKTNANETGGKENRARATLVGGDFARSCCVARFLFPWRLAALAFFSSSRLGWRRRAACSLAGDPLSPAVVLSSSPSSLFPLSLCWLFPSLSSPPPTQRGPPCACPVWSLLGALLLSFSRPLAFALFFLCFFLFWPPLVLSFPFIPILAVLHPHSLFPSSLLLPLSVAFLESSSP